MSTATQGKPIPALTAEQEERFWSLVAGISDPNRCWEWQQATGVGFKPQLSVGGTKYLARRVAYSLVIGPIPAGARLVKNCDNVACVNPFHLTPWIPVSHSRHCLSERVKDHSVSYHYSGMIRRYGSDGVKRWVTEEEALLKQQTVCPSVGA